jgi:hypothetical protein
MKGEKSMLRSIDTKSLVVGGLLVLTVVCLIGGAPYVEPEYHSRFQIATNQSHAFVLDSATGQVWSKNFAPEPSNIIGGTDAFHDQKFFEDEIPSEIVPPQQ